MVQSSRRPLHGCWLASAILTALCSVACTTQGDGAQNRGSVVLSGAYREVHDPSAILFDHGRYFFFVTGDNIPIRCSNDRVAWQQCGRVFDSVPLWAAEAVPGADGIWAPDISYYGGKFHLYYAVSVFGTNVSDIGLATNSTLDPSAPGYQWVDEGKVIGSKSTDDWNAIDPNLVLDAQGRPWLAFGSYWSGIKLVALDPATGKPPAGPLHLYPIAERFVSPGAIEAPFIIYRGGYYYLFASFDFCCRGADSTYNIRVGRSTSITGPYVDREGRPMMDDGGTLIATSSGTWRGPGGESLFEDTSGAWWIDYHVYDATLAGEPTLRINRLSWDRDGWPRPVPPS